MKHFIWKFSSAKFASARFPPRSDLNNKQKAVPWWRNRLTSPTQTDDEKNVLTFGDFFFFSLFRSKKGWMEASSRKFVSFHFFPRSLPLLRASTYKWKWGFYYMFTGRCRNNEMAQKRSVEEGEKFITNYFFFCKRQHFGVVFSDDAWKLLRSSSLMFQNQAKLGRIEEPFPIINFSCPRPPAESEKAFPIHICFINQTLYAIWRLFRKCASVSKLMRRGRRKGRSAH